MRSAPVSGTKTEAVTGTALSGWTIEAFSDPDGNGTLSQAELNAGPIASTVTVTAADGTYTMLLDTGPADANDPSGTAAHYVIVEVLQSGWSQTLPTTPVFASGVNNGSLGANGYAVEIDVGTGAITAKNSTESGPPVELGITKDHVGDFHQGDAADTYTITVSNTGTASTDGSPVTVIDTLPTGLSPTTADDGTINGWSVWYSTQADTITATRSDVLAAGDSYPDLTLTVAVAGNAPASVTNTATVSGGGALLPATATDLTTILYVQWDITKDHAGDFQQGDASDTYTITVTNAGTGPTNGTVTVTDPLPTGLSPTEADNGTINGWSVSYVAQTVTATRSDVLAAGDSYPDLTLTVAVADNAPASVTNTATVSGGRALLPATATDLTTILYVQWDITKDHVGDFQQGDASDTYTITVTNTGTGPTNGSLVTVTDPLPTGLSPTAADNGTINGWSVSYVAQTITATRSDVLAAGDSYPDLTLTVAVADNAPASVTNTATVSGGGASCRPPPRT